MSAPLLHAGFTFPGIHQDLIYGTPEAKNQKNEVFTLDGATVTDGGRGTREITCEIVLFNNYSNMSQFIVLLEAINSHVNAKGDLIDSIGQSFDDVLFLRMEPVEGPLYSAHLGVWKKVRLIFEDLTP